jgi:MFS family permease
MMIVDRSPSWRDLYQSGSLGRFVVLCLGIWLHAVDSLVTATIAPAIVDDIGGVAYINWTITLYEVGAILAGACGALLCQRFGIKRVLGFAALVYGCGCLIAGFAPRIGVLLAGRLVQGMGGGLLLTLCYIAVQEWFEPAWWGRLFGIVALIWGAGSLLGPLIGGVFAGLHEWRMTFLVFAAQAAVLWVLVFIGLPPQTRRQPTKSWPLLPLLLLTLAVMAIAESSIAPDVAVSLAGALGGLGILYAAARVDRRFGSRLFPVRLLDFRHPVGAGLLMVLALSTATTSFWAYGPLLLKILFGTQPLISGYILAGEAVAWSLATLAVARLPVSQDRTLIRFGAVLAALGAAGFALALPAGGLPGIVLCALLQGLGFGLCWPSVVRRMAELSTDAERPLAVTSPETMQRIGYAVGAAAVGIAANLSGLAAGISIAAAKSAAFWVFAAFVPSLILALFCAWRFTQDAARR